MKKLPFILMAGAAISAIGLGYLAWSIPEEIKESPRKPKRDKKKDNEDEDSEDEDNPEIFGAKIDQLKEKFGDKK